MASNIIDSEGNKYSTAKSDLKRYVSTVTPLTFLNMLFILLKKQLFVVIYFIMKNKNHKIKIGILIECSVIPCTK